MQSETMNLWKHTKQKMKLSNFHTYKHTEIVVDMGSQKWNS